MSRVAKNPIAIPQSVTVNINGQEMSIKGTKGTMQYVVPSSVGIIFEENRLHFEPRDASKEADALAGSTRAVLNNIVKGVSDGFECKLELHGVGYRAQIQGAKLNLTLGFSHPIEFHPPKGITLETPSQTEVVVKGADRQLVGQVAADIRAYRPPEPYKGKGVRYAGEKIILKETKKK